MRLQLELFVASIPASRAFYERVLGFDVVRYQPDGYSVFRKGETQIAVQDRSNLPDDHPVKPAAGERAGLGIEIVLEVDDLDAAHAQVLTAGWPLSSPIQQQPWGLRDFRVQDPDGLYIRITTPPGG